MEGLLGVFFIIILYVDIAYDVLSYIITNIQLFYLSVFYELYENFLKEVFKVADCLLQNFFRNFLT